VSGGRGTLLAIRFLSELALLAVLAVVGASLVDPLAPRVVLAIALPAAAIAVWGLFVAPKASRRLDDPTRLVVELVLFGAATAGLAAVGHVVPALVFGVVAIGAALLVRRYSPGS